MRTLCGPVSTLPAVARPEIAIPVIEYGGTYPAYWHTAGPAGEIPEAGFREICEYLDERERNGEIEVVLPSELGQ